jgi:hypothetical protein
MCPHIIQRRCAACAHLLWGCSRINQTSSCSICAFEEEEEEDEDEVVVVVDEEEEEEEEVEEEEEGEEK